MSKIIFWHLKNSPNDSKPQREEGIGCHVLSTIAKQYGYETIIYQDHMFDANPDRIIEATKKYLSSYKDIVAISLLSKGVDLLNLLAITDFFSEFPVIVGGPGVTIEPSRVLDILMGHSKYNAIVRGDGEPAFKKLLATSRDAWRSIPEIGYVWNDERNVGKHFLIDSLENSPIPDLSASAQRAFSIQAMSDAKLSLENRLEMAKSVMISQIEARRECYYRCEFCNQSSLPQVKVRSASPRKLATSMEELYSKYGITFFSITDNVAFDKVDWWMDFAEHLRTSDMTPFIQFGGYSAPAFVSKNAWLDYAAKQLYDVGLRGMILGVQAGSKRVLSEITHRSSRDPENALKVVNALVPMGVNVKVDFIVGHPTETVADIAETKKWANLIHDAGGEVFVRELQVVPHSGYYDKLASEVYSLPEKTHDYLKLVAEITAVKRMDDIYKKLAFADGKTPNKYVIDRNLGLVYPSTMFSTNVLIRSLNLLPQSDMLEMVKDRYALMYELVIKLKEANAQKTFE